MNRNIIKKILISSIVLVVIDYVYLSSVSKYYHEMIENIQNSKMIMNYFGVSICYILLVFNLNYFILNKPMSNNVFDAFLLGFTTYGIFDSTNYAVISNWRGDLSIMDAVWGGILYSLTTIITNSIIKK